MMGGWKERRRVACSLEFFVDPTLHFMSLQTQVHVPVSSMVDVILQRRGEGSGILLLIRYNTSNTCTLVYSSICTLICALLPCIPGLAHHTGSHRGSPSSEE